MTVEPLKQCMPVHRRCLLPSIMLAMLLGGCGDTSKSPEAPTVLGTPPSTAYLGADYSYNFGAHGGDNLLNYSLSNAPSWLALEETTNNARPGIVLRGQPGLSGGERGEADVGTYEQIKISSTDGALLGDGDFTIEVLHNALMIQNASITEGQPLTPDLNDRNEEVCEFPDMSHTWEAEVEHRQLRTATDSGNAQYESAERHYTAYPALVEVQLNEPSVEPVSVMFRVQEDFPRAQVGSGEEACDTEEGPPCEYAPRNRDKAVYGEDFVFNGGPDGRDMVKAGSVFPEPPDYLSYVEEGAESGEGDDGEARFGRGVLTFEPGITSCFIPVWVFDDDLAEDTESFDIILEEVTEGLASLEEEGAISSASVDIEDTTPEARFDLDEVVVTAGEDTRRDITVSLSRANDTGEALWAGIQCLDDDETGICGRVTLKHNGETLAGDEDGNSLPVRFAPGESESTIHLEVSDDGGENGDGYPYSDDEQFELIFDRSYQFGLEFAARVSGSEAMDVFINEWAESLPLEDDRWTSVAAGTFGEAYLAGITDDSDELILRSVNRLGDTQGDDSAFLTEQDDWLAVADGVPPTLAFTGRSTGTSSAPEITRNLAVGYTARDGGDGVLALFRSRLEVSGDEDNDQLVIVCEEEPAEASKQAGRLWEFRSNEDSDAGPADLRALVVSAAGDLFWGGNQDGDILVSRINSVTEQDEGDTEDNGNNCEGEPERERTEAVFQWSNLISAGGGLESDVVGLTRPTFGSMNVLGWSQGDIGSGNDLGGDTFAFLSLDEDGEVTSDNQFGTNENDRFSHAVEAGNRTWAAGTGQVRYERDEDGFIDADASEPVGYNNPFVFAISGGGSVEGVLNLGDESGDPQAERISALAAEGSTAFVGGDSRDASGSEPFLASVTLDTQDEVMEQDWRIELEGAESVVDLSVFEGRKLFVLLEMPAGNYELRLYSREGTLLTR